MSEFFKSQLDYLLFFHGSALLLLVPLTLLLRGQANPRMAWASLGWFGVSQGLQEWLGLIDPSLKLGPEMTAARLVLQGGAVVFLAEFGRASLARMGRRTPGRWAVGGLVGLAGLGGLVGAAGFMAASRYALALSGAWAAGALYLAGGSTSRGAWKLRGAALGVLGYALAAALVPAPAPFVPAIHLNTDSWLQATGIPIQLGCGLLAVWTSLSLAGLAQNDLTMGRQGPFHSSGRYLLRTTLTGIVLLWVGGWFLTQYFGGLADRELRHKFNHSVRLLHRFLLEDMAETDNLVKSLTDSPTLAHLLSVRTDKNLAKVNALLDRCSLTLNRAICYVMDGHGITIASSNREAPDSFVGQSYAFRPYFQQGREGLSGRYWALGVTSKELGYYASEAIRDQAGNVVGVAVVKRNCNEMGKIFHDQFPGLIIDSRGIVIMANLPEMVLRSLWPLTKQTRQEVLASRQFGDGPFIPILDRPPEDGGECRFGSERLRVLMQPGFWRDWSVVSLESMASINQGRLLGISATVIFNLLLLGFLAIAVLVRESEAGFRQLFDNAVDILILHNQGKITAVNQQACTSLGYTRKELEQMSLFDLEMGIGIDDLLNTWHHGGVAMAQTATYRRRDGSTFLAEVRTADINYRGQELKLATVRDVTERKRAEMALREREKRFRDVAENAQEWVWEVDVEGRYTYTSPIVERLLGYQPEEILGRHFYEFFVPEDQERLMILAFMAFAGKRPFRDFLNRNRHKEGRVIYLSTSGVPILDKAGNLLGYRGIGTDITERQQAEAALRESQESYRLLASKLMTVQEAERQRLARELHDDQTQRLAVLAMEAGEVEMRLGTAPLSASAAKLQEIREKLVQLSMDVHALSRRLHPSILDDLGLADAIASECASLRQHQGLATVYRSRDVPAEIPRETAINLYRIVQEALRNIAKHAKAHKVEVNLVGRKHAIHLTIKDDGQGIDPGERKSPGLGLVSMRERATLIGGTISISSWPGKGTAIEVTAPLSGSMT